MTQPTCHTPTAAELRRMADVLGKLGFKHGPGWLRVQAEYAANREFGAFVGQVQAARFREMTAIEREIFGDEAAMDDVLARAIIVWQFADAPAEFRELSGHGGDEDWLALAPMSLADDFIDWLDSGTAFGRCDTSRHELPDGSVVYIGAHA